MANLIYGYCRVSTMKQSLERQEQNIKNVYPDAIIIKESYTGKTMNRPAWSKLYKQVMEQRDKGNDITIVFDEVSRMSRNAEDGFKIYRKLYDKGIRLCFLKEPHLNTDLFRETQNAKIDTVGNDIADLYIETTNKVLMMLAEKQIKAAFESAEWELITKSKNTSDGVRRAQADGKQVGRAKGVKVETKKCKAAKDIIKKHSKSFDGTLDDADVIKLAGISRNSYYKYKAQIKDEL